MKKKFVELCFLVLCLCCGLGFQIRLSFYSEDTVVDIGVQLGLVFEGVACPTDRKFVPNSSLAKCPDND